MSADAYPLRVSAILSRSLTIVVDGEANNVRLYEGSGDALKVTVLPLDDLLVEQLGFVALAAQTAYEQRPVRRSRFRGWLLKP